MLKLIYRQKSRTLLNSLNLILGTYACVFSRKFLVIAEETIIELVDYTTAIHNKSMREREKERDFCGHLGRFDELSRISHLFYLVDLNSHKYVVVVM